jgi:probable biosynthetic protein (TIGR04098 family)
MPGCDTVAFACPGAAARPPLVTTSHPMHRTHSTWHLGMPHTISGALGEVALLAHAQDLHWNELGALAGCPASRFRDAAGSEVYASIYFAELDGTGDRGLAAFRPDDEIEVFGTLGRYGPSMLDGVHRLYPAGTAASAAASVTPSLVLRLSFVLVAMGRGPDELRVSTPANGRIDRVPSLADEPDSYRLVKTAQRAGGFGEPPAGARRLWADDFSRDYPIDPDRDLNGVGLLYFANYVALLDSAERAALEERAGLAAEHLDGRVTVRRRVAYYGNACSSDRLRITVEAYTLGNVADGRFRVHHRVHRISDGRLIALASAERRLRSGRSGEPID